MSVPAHQTLHSEFQSVHAYAHNKDEQDSEPHFPYEYDEFLQFPLSKIDVLVTNEGADPDIINQIKEAGIDVYLN